MSGSSSSSVGPSHRPERRRELDTIRILVVLGLVFFHSGLVFDAEDDYYVKNPETTGAVKIIAGFGVVWAMPMLFLIAGFGSWYSLRRRGPGGFAAERLLRLGVPLLVATAVLAPLPQWLRARGAEGYRGSYAEFLPKFFEVRLVPADFPFVLRGTYFETGHLWFVVLLLTFSLLLAPLVARLPRARVARLRERAGAAVARRGLVLVAPAVPVLLLCSAAGLEEDYAGWNRWAYLLFFLYGFLLASDVRYRLAMRRDAVPAAAVAGVLFLACLPGFGLVDGDPFNDMTPLAVASRAFFGATGWCAVVAILGLLDRRQVRRQSGDGEAARPESAAEAASEQPAPRQRAYVYLGMGALAVYVLHQPVVVAVAYLVVGWDAPLIVKYLAIVGASLLVTLAAYDLLVRRTRVTRFLFGMRG